MRFFVNSRWTCFATCQSDSFSSMVNVRSADVAGVMQGRLNFEHFTLMICRKHSHLGWRTNRLILRSDSKEPNPVPVLLGHSVGPILKLGTGPLETVIRVPELAGGQGFPGHVVLSVGRRQHDRLRPGKLE